MKYVVRQISKSTMEKMRERSGDTMGEGLCGGYFALLHLLCPILTQLTFPGSAQDGIPSGSLLCTSLPELGRNKPLLCSHSSLNKLFPHL